MKITWKYWNLLKSRKYYPKSLILFPTIEVFFGYGRGFTFYWLWICLEISVETNQQNKVYGGI